MKKILSIIFALFLILIFLVFMISVLCFRNNISDSFYESGNKKCYEKNFEGALIDYKIASIFNKESVSSYQFENVEGIIKCNKELEKDPKNDKYYDDRAMYKSEVGDKEGALVDISEAIKLNPAGENYYDLRSTINLNLGHYEDAVNDYTQAINWYKTYKKNDKDFNAKLAFRYNMKGQTNYRVNNYNASIKDFDQAILYNPGNSYYYYRRGLAKAYLIDYRGAIEDYNKYLKYDSKDYKYTVYYLRGLAKNSLKDYKGALEDFDIVIQSQDKDHIYDAYLNRGITKKLIKDYGGALIDFNKAKELNGGWLPHDVEKQIEQLKG